MISFESIEFDICGLLTFEIFILFAMKTFQPQLLYFSQETANHVVFRNRVIYGNPESPQLNGDIECRLARHLQAEVNSSPFADNVQFTQVGFGNFSFDMDLYPDVGYGSPYLPDDYPVEAEIGEDLFVEARVDTKSDIDLLIDACWATDSADPDDADGQYYLISSG